MIYSKNPQEILDFREETWMNSWRNTHVEIFGRSPRLEELWRISWKLSEWDSRTVLEKKIKVITEQTTRSNSFGVFKDFLGQIQEKFFVAKVGRQISGRISKKIPIGDPESIQNKIKNIKRLSSLSYQQKMNNLIYFSSFLLIYFFCKIVGRTTLWLSYPGVFVRSTCPTCPTHFPRHWFSALFSYNATCNMIFTSSKPTKNETILKPSPKCSIV